MATFTINKAIERIFDCLYFHPSDSIGGKIAIPYRWVPGSPDSRLVLVLGDNGGGKSFFRRLFRAVTFKDSQGFDKPGDFPLTEVIHLSMQGRSTPGIMRAFVYGDESWSSTGQISAHGVEGAITTAKGRDHDTSIYWDEPDIGMSAACSAGVGVVIREFMDEIPDHVKIVVVTSHSPALVSELLKGKERPHYIYLGGDNSPPTLEDWIVSQTTNIVPILPRNLGEMAHTRFKAIQAISDDSKAKERAKKEAKAKKKGGSKK